VSLLRYTSDRLCGNPALAHPKTSSPACESWLDSQQARMPVLRRWRTACPCLRGRETPTCGVWFSKAPKAMNGLPSN